MVTVFSAYIVPIITGAFIFGILTWVGFLLFWWLPRKMGLQNYLLINRVKRKYKKNFEYDDETIRLCQKAITRGWKLNDMVILTKGSPHRDEILYTFINMMKIKKDWFDPKTIHESPQSNNKFLEDMVKKLK